MTQQTTNQQIAIYQTADGKVEIDVCLEQETVWLWQEQMSELFGRERSVISKHIRNVFIEGELDEKSNVQNLHIAGSGKLVKFYNLWSLGTSHATKVEHEKLADLRQTIALSSRLIHNKDLSINESQGILAILEKYSHALTVLDDYDHQRLAIEGTHVLELPKITYDEAIEQIRLWRHQENLRGLFGKEKTSHLFLSGF